MIRAEARSEAQKSYASGEVMEFLAKWLSKSSPFEFKGEAGCVGVLGGCREACGPPFFAAMAALRTGCDIARIFTTESAAAAVRAYSAGRLPG
jgi:NAD(P)H-hydrate repair Nnr-like enzyme with NAD(P)H-hydrate dehydratase domain